MSGLPAIGEVLEIRPSPIFNAFVLHLPASEWFAPSRPAKRWWAPGNYQQVCVHCSMVFMGDKRAFECEACAYKALDTIMAQPFF